MKDVNLSPKQVEAWSVFLTAHDLLTREVNRHLTAKKVINLDTYNLLMTLEAEEDNRLRLSELANKNVFSKSGLSRVVDRLERMGFVRREPCESDARGFYAVITESGKSERLLAQPHVDQALLEVWAVHVSDSDASLIKSVFGSVINQNNGVA